MRYNPGQFSAPSSPTTPSIGGGTYTPVSTSGNQITIGGGAASVPGSIGKAPRAGSVAPMTPSLIPSNPDKGTGVGGVPTIKQTNPYGGQTGNGYHHDSGWWKGRQVSNRQHAATTIDGKPVPVPPKALQGNMPYRPFTPNVPLRGGTSMDNPNPGGSSLSAGNAALGSAGSGSGKLASPVIGLRGM